MKTKNEFIVLGSGGHAAVIVDLLESLNYKIIGILTKEKSLKEYLGYPILGDDSILKTFTKSHLFFANGIGFVNNSLKTRKDVFEKLQLLKLKVPILKHKSAIVSARSVLKEGCQILAGTNIGVNVLIGENTIVNSNVTIEHGSIIGPNCHIAPGSILCGNVNIGENTFIGAGSTIINDINISKNCLIGAGSLLLKDIKKSGKYFGHPVFKMK
jgi:UDP-perosamine 4-acetyltransferase